MKKKKIYRILVKKARKIAMEYELMYGEEIPTTQLVMRLAAVMQEYTQSWCFIFTLSIFVFSIVVIVSRTKICFWCLKMVFKDIENF